MTASIWSGPAAETVKAEILDILRRDPARLTEDLFGAPKSRRGREWRFPGSISLVVSGAKRGLWSCWKAGAHGYVHSYQLAPIRFALGCDWADAWDWAARFTGRTPPPDGKPMTPEERRKWREEQRRKAEEERKRRAAIEARESAKKIADGWALWETAGAIDGTPGAKYLIEVRLIPEPAAGWPTAIRWHPGKHALVFAATTAAGAIEAVQAIHLTPDGQNKRRLDGSKIKLTHGSLANHPAVRLPAIDRGLDAPLQHAEGPETGLSAWRATGLPTWIHLGPMSRARLPAGRANIILRDDDAPGSKADDSLETALAGWRQDGVRVVAATPWPERRGDKSDFNDVLRTAVGREGEGETEKPGLPPVPGSLRADAPPRPPDHRPLCRALPGGWDHNRSL
jgi:putative DNA primase/helicase